MKSDGRILVLEDEPELLEALVAYLDRKGYEVCAAEDLATARHHLDQSGVDLAVIDVGAHGLRLAREAAALNIPCVLMSGRPVILEMGGLGAVLAKPFKLDVLGARVAELLRCYRDAPRLGRRESGHPAPAPDDAVA